MKGLGLSGGDSKTLNLAILAPQMVQILRFWKIEGFRLVWGGFKNVKFSHFGTPNGSNLAILKKLKGLGLFHIQPKKRNPMESSRTYFSSSPNLTPLPIASMYGIFTYIYHKYQPNVGKYTIHGSYGLASSERHLAVHCLVVPPSRDPSWTPPSCTSPWTPRWNHPHFHPWMGSSSGSSSGVLLGWSCFCFFFNVCSVVVTTQRLNTKRGSCIIILRVLNLCEIMYRFY